MLLFQADDEMHNIAERSATINETEKASSASKGEGLGLH